MTLALALAIPGTTSPQRRYELYLRLFGCLPARKWLSNGFPYNTLQVGLIMALKFRDNSAFRGVLYIVGINSMR